MKRLIAADADQNFLLNVITIFNVVNVIGRNNLDAFVSSNLQQERIDFVPLFYASAVEL